MIQPARPLLAVLGADVSGSASPAMHCAAARALGLTLDYLALSCPEPRDFRDAIEGLIRLGARGANVTAPYKEAAVPLTERTKRAEEIGAVNTITWDAQHAVGDNTDGPGFLAWLEELPNDLLERVAVLGAGGAARGVLWALRRRGVGHVVLCARSHGPSLGADRRTGLDPQPDATLFISTLPPMAAPVAEKLLHPDASLIDLVYRPDATPPPLVRSAVERGLLAMDGRRLLAEQGAISFSHWLEAELSPVRKVMIQAMSV
ncbi:MAG: shikimate dehydrogenase [Myxococcota bacterium]